MIERIVVVGASTAGLATAESVRDAGFRGEVVLLGAEQWDPYRRPALSKQILLGTWKPDQARLVEASTLRALGIDFRPGHRAVRIDRRSRTVQTDHHAIGTDIVRYDAVVIATGASARRPSWAPYSAEANRPAPAVHVLRTLDDALRIAGQLVRRRRVTVVGTGVLGSEIASAATARGARVSLVGRSAGLSLGAAGLRFSDRLRALHAARDVEVRTGAEVVAVRPTDGPRYDVRFADGTRLGSDVVIAAAGAEPAVAWLADSGLLTDGSLLADSHGRVADRVFAVGDASSWLDPATGTHRACGHQLTAMEQGRSVGRLLAAGQLSPYPIPFFWSEIHGARVQASGRLDIADSVELLAGDHDSDQALFGFRAGDHACGLVAWNMPKPFRNHQAALLAELSAAGSAAHLLETS
ncbi:NAD(P)/FAD-dependent oxidoreductase [Kribbella soli]|uniref:NAD(P)/FAD-dependent oxidoreductase n=1 Tax=Kribbella soli TaxID=1124743 RepID=UPI0013F3F2E6|nr:FAD/NAD(P)-binding oxidoreductase [Kribbella soli]